VASTNNFGLRKYAIRIWLAPERLANMGMTPMDVENAIKEQNNQVAAGKQHNFVDMPDSMFLWAK
jgi:HAE1 family hydrophobic/amphiphilic exporter-1